MRSENLGILKMPMLIVLFPDRDNQFNRNFLMNITVA